MPDPRVNQPPAAPAAVFSGVLEPGNGGRYEYIVWRTEDGQWYAAFPDFYRASRIGSGRHFPDYVGEKFHCSQPDAEVMCGIINWCVMGLPHPINMPSREREGSLEDFLAQVRRG